MYINFQKYNYELLENAEERAAYEERDKKAYKEILRNWFEENLNDSVSRKWEVKEIHYLKNISEFINLIREAENLYELGFFTGCIALTGISAEDFARYYAILKNKSQFVSLSQHSRLQNLKNHNLLSQGIYVKLDDIRKIRNDCLHYNDSFKQKPKEELKTEALLALNNLKEVLKELIGTGFSGNTDEFISIVRALADQSDDIRNFDELVMKQRNAFSHIFNFGYAQHPEKTEQFEWEYFKVMDVDDDEVTLLSLVKNMPAIVDLDDEFREKVQNCNISPNDIVIAQITSKLNNLGMTAFWHFVSLQKVEKTV